MTEVREPRVFEVDPRSTFQEAWKRHDFQFYSRADIQALPAPEWWLEDFWQQGTVGLLVGEGGIGKTLLMLDMMSCVSLGIPWNGMPTKKARVLYVAAEGVRSFDKRITAWETRHDVAFPDSEMVFLASGFRLTADDESDRAEALTAAADAFAADVIVLDTLSALSDLSDENSSAAIAGIIRVAHTLIAGGTRTVILIHHAAKGTGKSRGSSAIRDNVSTLVAARWPKRKDTSDPTETFDKSAGFYLSTMPADDGKQRDGKPVKLRGFSIEQEGESAVIVKAAEGEQLRAEEKAIQAALGDGQGHAMGDIVAALHEIDASARATEDRMLRQSLRRTLKPYIDKGAVLQLGTGKATTYQLEGTFGYASTG